MKPGDRISRYRILSRIGKGGMGEVYQAEDTRLERQVALKFLPQDGFTETGKSRFLNEARAAAKARHPNICPIHDVEEIDGELFIVMAYIEGETLARKIARQRLDPSLAIDLSIQVASGLARAHEMGIIHRDIKSGNIIIESNGHASILDFGLALAPSALRVTGTGHAVGTPAYMSPEQVQGHEVDARTDLWSLGVVMYEMITGALPFQRDHASAVIYAVLQDPPPPIASFRPGVPAKLQAIIEKALSKGRAERWQSAAELLSELKQLRGSGSIELPEDIATQTIITLDTIEQRRLSWRAALMIAGALTIGGGGWALMHRTGSPAGAPASVSASKQLAILPFEVLGGDPQIRTVSDGLADEISTAITDLTRAQTGSIATIPVTELRARNVDTAQEAHRLYGVNRALQGSAQSAGDKIEFNLRVVDAATLKQVAARNFLYDPENPLVSRNQAVGQVLAMMNLNVPAAELSRVTATDSPAPSAYSAYLKGRGFLARYDLPGNLDRAIASFREATREDSKFALAYSGLAEAYWTRAAHTGDKQDATLANQNAEYAVQLDPNIGVIHNVLGTVYDGLGRQQDAVHEFERAMQLAPDNAEAARNLAEIYKRLGRFNDAETLYVRSTKMRPTDWLAYRQLGIFYYERERYGEAEAALNQAKNIAPDNDFVRRDLGGVYRMHGRYRESVVEYQQALRIRSSAGIYVGLGGAYYFLHQFPEAVAALEAAIDLDSSDYRYWGNLGIYCKWAPGNEAKSAPALRRAIELATKLSETQQNNFNIVANLAEYRARLGDAKGAEAEIDKIPPSGRVPFTTRLAIVYELTGHHDRAVQVVRDNFKSPESLNQIKDDPDLANVWRDLQRP